MFGGKKRQGKVRTLKPWEEKIAIKLVRGIYRVQIGWATYMGKSFNRLSQKGKKWALLLFCLVAASLCTFSIAYHSEDLSSHPKIDTRLILPKAMPPQQESKLSLPASSTGRIRQFKKYLDSLGTDATGARSRDSLLRHRPGLLDSIRQVEQYYDLQLNNE